MLTAVTFFDPVVSTDPGISDAPSTAAPTSSLEPGRYSYVNSNVVRDIVVQNGVAYAATLGGLAAWNLSDGYAMNYTPLQGMGHVSSYAVTACEINGEEQIVIGTLQGISLFDPFYGRWDTTPLTPEDSLVATSKIDRLFCDQANGRLLIAYSGLGVLDLATGDFERFTKDNGLSWNAIFDIAVNGRDIWVASGYNGLSQISDGQVTIHNKASGMPDERAYSLAFAPDGTLWVGGAAGLMQFKNGQWTLYDVLADINEVELAADGTLWLAAASMGGGSLCHFDPQTGECAAVYPEPENQGILALSLDDQGRPVYGTDKGVYRFDAAADTAVPYINEYDMLLSNDVASLTTAPNGMLWLGTNAGIQVLDPAFPDMLWTTYRKADTPGMGGNWGVAAAAAPDGTVWIAMTNGDASRFRDGVWQSFAELRSYDSVAVDADGRAWFGDEDKGIVVLNDDGSTAMTLTMAEGLPSNRVTALLADGETMWIAQDVGLTKYADGQVTLVLDKNRLPHPYLQALALDAAGKLLVGANLSIVRYDGDQTETLINFQQEKQMAWLTTLAVERDGRIWAGTANGLYYSDNGSDWNRMTTADGLLANYISALLVDQYGTLWIGGGGLLHIVP
jgi:ligand-binding sensor domain-containing protein